MGDDSDWQNQFLAMQSKIIAIEEEVGSLKDQLRSELDVSADLAKLESELRDRQSAREATRLTHEQSLETVKAELVSLRKAAEEALKIEKERISAITIEISELTQKLKEGEEAGERLKSKLTDDDAAIQKKARKYYRMLLREQNYRPYVEFLKLSRSVPMYLEDLGSRIASLRAAKGGSGVLLETLSSQIEELRQNHRSIKAQIQAKSNEMRSVNSQAEATNARLENAGKEIESTQKALSEAHERLKAAKAQRVVIGEERGEVARELEELRRAHAAELTRLADERAAAEAALDQAQSSRDQELAVATERVQALRKRLSYIREKGDDPEVPRLDVDLRRQIERVRADKTDLARESERVRAATECLEIQLQQKTWDLQTIILKMQPTQSVLSMPEFQEKFVLLKELVLQNMDLRGEVSKLTERIAVLQSENEAFRRRLRGQ
jgi:chromosome segregation ATPase